MSSYLLKLKPFGLVTVGVLSTLGTLSLAHLGPAQAQSPGVNLAALLARLTADEATIKTQGSTIATLQALTAPLSLSNDPFVAGKNNLLTITGVNVRIINGLGAAAANAGTINGLGNLTVGYNVVGNTNGDIRTGSHNLIVGDYNNYSSYGGLIAGGANTISGPYASVSGGAFSMASGIASSVSSGYLNTASGYASGVSGGQSNTASGDYSSVSGGKYNNASGNFSSVSGGINITQGTDYGWSGGTYSSP